MASLPELTPSDKARYEWQMWVAGFGEEGQRRLKAASVLVSRIGGVGGMVAMHLAAAGVGRLVLAHHGEVRPSDLNRQLLMSHEGLGFSRVKQATARLRAFNPDIVIDPVEANIDRDNVAELVGRVDAVASCAPLFAERLLMNGEAVRRRKPLVDAAMFDMDAQLLTVLPGKSACLRCLYPEESPAWRRQFPVFGAVAGTIGSLAAVEMIKVLAGLEQPLAGRLLVCDLRTMDFRKIACVRNPQCRDCGDLR